MHETDLRGAPMDHMHAPGMDLRWANLDGADLDESNLTSGNFQNAVLPARG